MEPNRWQACTFEQGAEAVFEHIFPVYRPAHGIRKYEVVLLPGGPNNFPFLALSLPVLPERLNGHHSERDTTSAPFRLWSRKDEIAPQFAHRCVDVQPARIEINFPPFEAEQLALAHTGCERQHIERF